MYFIFRSASICLNSSNYVFAVCVVFKLIYLPSSAHNKLADGDKVNLVKAVDHIG